MNVVMYVDRGGGVEFMRAFTSMSVSVWGMIFIRVLNAIKFICRYKIAYKDYFTFSSNCVCEQVMVQHFTREKCR